MTLFQIASYSLHRYTYTAVIYYNMPHQSASLITVTALTITAVAIHVHAPTIIIMYIYISSSLIHTAAGYITYYNNIVLAKPHCGYDEVYT